MNSKFQGEAKTFVEQNEDFMKVLSKSNDPMDQAIYRKFMEAAGKAV